MQLHRVHGKADWADIDPVDRNSWQRLAAATHGILTIANMVSVVGLSLVLWGLFAIHQEQYWLGLILLAVGRLADVLDGVLADKTGTKSTVGEAVDVVADKAATILTVALFFFDSLAPWPLLALALLPHVLIMTTPLIQWFKGNRTHPSRTGKLSMAILWVSLVGFILTAAVHSPYALHIICAVGLVVSTILGLDAVGKYVRRDS